jgi:serine protease Do
MVVLVAASALVVWDPSRSWADELNPITQAKALSRAFRGAADRVAPSVVTVIAKVKVTRQDLWPDSQLRRRIPFFLPDQPSRSDGEIEQRQEMELEEIDAQLGSGIIIHTNGTVLTNNHVVHGADRVVLRLPNGTEVTAKDIRSDQKSDLAILRMNAHGPFRAAELGDSSALQIGDWVIAIGSPFELDATVSAGIISGKGRVIEKIERGKLLQTDAAINPGNSGGPLVNLDGQVVGINTAIASSSGGYQGIGFAIPVNHARWVVQQLVQNGRVHRGYLGINIGDIDVKTSSQYNRPVRSGVIVRKVLDGSPAALAGMKQGDVIVSFAGSTVNDLRDLQTEVEQKAPGTKQGLTVVRNGESLELQIEVRELPADESS